MEIYPVKGLYRPDENIVLEIRDAKGAEYADVDVFRLWMSVCSKRVSLKNGGATVTIPPSGALFAGFAVRCIAENGEHCTCAFDVQDSRRVFRYGFLSDFLPDDGKDTDVLAMAKHHINAVQFYDWSYRHHELVSDTEEYTDMMGKRNSLTVIRSKISACHDRGMRAMAYAAVYASAEDFAQKHPEWRLYGSPNKPIRFIDVFAIMNLRSGWKEHIIGQYRQSIKRAGFDGIHMDTYGFPKTALDYRNCIIHLQEDFPELIKQTRAALPYAELVFNNVGAWPVESTMHEDVGTVYIEVWPPYKSYYHLKELINTAKRAGKPVVMAAYPAAFRTDTPLRALNSELMLMCAINAHGATQLWFGEENAAITQGYYADYAALSAKQEPLLRRYEDFFTSYEELFFDSALKDVSMTHFGWDNTEYRCNTDCSAAAQANKPWIIIREKPGMKLITMINMCGDASDEWASGRDDCTLLHDITISIEIPEGVKSVYTATPDYKEGMLLPCEYRISYGAKCPEASFALPDFERIAFAVVYLTE